VVTSGDICVEGPWELSTTARQMRAGSAKQTIDWTPSVLKLEGTSGSSTHVFEYRVLQGTKGWT
jgi:hypothetical protein